MSNLTISVDDQVLKRARIRALEQGSSVNAVLRELLEAYAGVGRAQSAAASDLAYLSDADAPEKRDIARGLLEREVIDAKACSTARIDGMRICNPFFPAPGQ